MADSQIDYNIVLADLKAKREQLDGAIAAIEAMLGLRAAVGQASDLSAQPARQSNAVEPGAFLGMTILDATAKLLHMKRQPLTTAEILAALRQGGLAFSTDNPINTVGSVLSRAHAQGGTIVKTGRGQFGLAVWYPRLRRKPDRKPGNGGTVSEADDAAENADGGAPEITDDSSSPNEP